MNRDFKALRAAARAAEIEALREGRKNRSNTFANRKKEASRKACRVKVKV
jgi:hypothetical protein